MIGKILGSRYEITGQIGEGGMALVYKAFDRKLNRYVAVKILRKEYLDNQEFLNRFKIESQAAASLSHPNIVSIYDVGFEDNIHYIVMEYVKGKTLKQLVDEMAPMSERDVLDISSQICAGIDHAHKNHIVHRDIKPHNIIITNEGIAKITDFGIARDVNSSTMTATGNIIGSVHYFSPEQAKGGHVDEKSDIYSLGVVMYEMATGKLPFDDDSAISIALKHVNESFKKPGEINRNISLALDKIISKAMEKNAFDRYMNASLMLNDISDAKLQLTDKYSSVPKNNIQDTQVISSREINNVLNKNDEMTESRPKNVRDVADNEVNDNMAKVANKKKKMDKTTKIAIGTATVLILLITIGVGLMIKSFFNVKPETKVPLVQGYSKDDAKRILDKKNLKWRIKDIIHDETQEKGVVITQDPKEGMTVKEGFTVSLVLNEGAKKYKIPDVVGKDVDKAKALLKEKGFSPQVVRVEDDADKGQVLDQEPLAGTRGEEGDKVKLTVSNGKDRMTVVPNLVGQSVEAAKKALKDAKLKYNDIDFNWVNDTEPKGTVIRQNFSANQQVPIKTTINLVLSTGQPPEPTKVTVPSLIGQEKAKALELIQKSGLVVQDIQEKASNDPKGTVVEQSLVANTQVDKNTMIIIYISSGPDQTKEVSGKLQIDLPTDSDSENVDVSVVDKKTGEEVFNQSVPVAKGSINVTVHGEVNTQRTYEITIDGQDAGEKIVSFYEE